MDHYHTAKIELAALQSFCSRYSVTCAHALSAAWSVTQHTFTCCERATVAIRYVQAAPVEQCKLEVRPSWTFLETLDQRGHINEHQNGLEEDPSTELQLAKLGSGRIGILIQSTSLLSLADNLVATFQVVLASVCKDPARPIQELDFCSVSDLDVIRKWTKNISPKQQSSIPQMVSSQARKTPHALAIEAHDGTLTYLELDRASSSLAQHLVQNGVSPGSCILLYFRRGLWAYVSMLAVLKARCCYAAVEAYYPPEYATEAVRQAHIKVAMTDPAYSAALAAAYDLVISVTQSLVFGLPEKTNPPDYIDPDDTCFIIFTSGSSGKRKGIRQQHGTFCTSLVDFGETLSISPATRILCSEDLSFAIANAEIFAALAFGAVACVPSDTALSDGYATAINQSRATLFLNSPTSIALLDPAEVPTLTTISSLGEPLSKEIIARWAPAVRLGNIYGMSECSIWVGFSDHISPETTSVSIGRVPTGAIYLANPNNPHVLVPVGAIGIIIFEGPIAAGYIDTSSDYQADFLDPIPAWLGILHAEHRELGKLYRSGDLGRYNPDGTIEYLGRKNRTIKIDGNFVNVEDIESLVRPSIGAHGLVAVEVMESGRPFCAIFVQSSFTSGQLGNVTMVDSRKCEGMWKAIEESLQEIPWMRVVRKAFYSIASMPKTPTGKIDRRQLRAWTESNQ